MGCEVVRVYKDDAKGRDKCSEFRIAKKPIMPLSANSIW
jgi:hypothetical protein